MQRSKILIALVSVLALTGLAPKGVHAGTPHGYYGIRFHGPHFRFGFYGYRYRPFYYFRPYRYLYRPFPYYYRPRAYAGVYPYATYAPYQGYSYGSGAVRTPVKPKQTEVYVDGYYAGIVDDFDGSFQKLYLQPGEHVIELRLEGYRTFQQRILATPSHTQKIHHQMVPLGPGETNPEPPDYRKQRVPEPSDEKPQPPSSPPPPPQPGPQSSPTPRSSSARFGVLALRVQPADAEVRIDGEPWGNLRGIGELSIHLPAGTHWIEIRREGVPVFSTEVEIRRGETTPLNVRLAL